MNAQTVKTDAVLAVKRKQKLTQLSEKSGDLSPLMSAIDLVLFAIDAVDDLRVELARTVVAQLQHDLLRSWEGEGGSESIGTGMGVLEYDLANRKAFLSPELKRIFGLDPSETPLKLDYLSFTHPDDQHRVEAAIQRVITAQSSGNFVFDRRIVRPDGSVRWLNSRGMVIFDRRGSAAKPIKIIAICHDRTEDIRRAATQNDKSRLEQIGRRTREIAHDTNNLLTIVKSNVELVRLFPSSSKVSSWIQTTLDAIDLNTSVNRSLMNYVGDRLEGTIECDVNEVISDMFALLRHSIGSDIVLRLALKPTLRRTSVDPTQVRMALINLVINARDAIESSGEINIETRNALYGRAEAQKLQIIEGEYVSLCVSDTGSGISSNLRDKVFEPFFTTKQNRQGFGLGLSNVRDFAVRGGGTVIIESEVGKGTSVTVLLKAAP